MAKGDGKKKGESPTPAPFIIDRGLGPGVGLIQPFTPSTVLQPPFGPGASLQPPKAIGLYDEGELEQIGGFLFSRPPFSNPNTPARCMEIASGSGQLTGYIASLFPHVTIQPSEWVGSHGSIADLARYTSSLEPVFASIRAFTEGHSNVLKPLEFNPKIAAKSALAVKLPLESFDAVFSAKLLHMAPLEVSHGLFMAASHLLRPGGTLYVYGPFRRGKDFGTDEIRALDKASDTLT